MLTLMNIGIMISTLATTDHHGSNLLLVIDCLDRTVSGYVIDIIYNCTYIMSCQELSACHCKSMYIYLACHHFPSSQRTRAAEPCKIFYLWWCACEVLSKYYQNMMQVLTDILPMLHVTPRCNLKDPCNIKNINNKIIHRPEEAVDIQSELIFVNSMVHLPQE